MMTTEEWNDKPTGGDLIPKADAGMAVALAYQRAADRMDCVRFDPPDHWDTQTQNEFYEIIKDECMTWHTAIFALAPADALAEVERMKAEIAELKTYRDYGPRMDEKRQAAIMELALGADRLDHVEARQAAEAEVARLTLALEDIRAECGCSIARAALKGDTP